VSLNLQPPPEPDEVPLAPDEATAHWEEELDHKKHSQLLDFRETYLTFAIGLTQAWVGLLFIITLSQLALHDTSFHLTEKEFMTVFGGSTAGIFTYAAIVGKCLFPKDGFTKEWGQRIKTPQKRR
jgi:hypothetical protein